MDLPTEPSTIPQIVSELRAKFDTGITLPLEWRLKNLRQLKQCAVDHYDEWVKAMNDDMGSHFYEAGLLMQALQTEIQETIDSLPNWIAPVPTTNPWSLYPGSSELVPEPYGVVCDFVPYNYPVFLGFSTIVPILAAGNVCLFKPSSNTPACARLYQLYFPQYLEGVAVVCGPTSICDHILKERFDFIFYTGSPRIAKNVMHAAAEHLTPVLLELGGKCPCYFDSELSLAKCVRRTLFAKIFNGGQTCVAPDYCLVHESVFDQVEAEFVKSIKEFYGDKADTQINDNITHIINSRHFERINRAIESSGGRMVYKGYQDSGSNYIGPTIISEPNLDSQLMTEEIFGPVIPLIKVKSANDAIAFIRAREKPLACYLMSSNSTVQNAFKLRTSSGALMYNDATFHVSASQIPFGGVGNSGLGQYHGEQGFKSLSHMKPVVSHSTFIDLNFRYPPYTEGHLKVLKKFC